MSRLLNLIKRARGITGNLTQIPPAVIPPLKLPASISSTGNISNLLLQPLPIEVERKTFATVISLRSFSTRRLTDEYFQIDDTKVNNTIGNWRSYADKNRISKKSPTILDGEIEELFRIFRQAVIHKDKKQLTLVRDVFHLPSLWVEQQAYYVARAQKINFTELYEKYWLLHDSNSPIPRTLGPLALVEAGSKLDITFIQNHGRNHNLIGDRSIANQVFRAMYLTEGKPASDMANAILMLRAISQNSFSYAYHAQEDSGNYLYHLFLKDQEPWMTQNLIDSLVPVNDGHSGYSPGRVFFRPLSKKEKSPCTILLESKRPDWKEIADKINFRNNRFNYSHEKDRYDTLENTLKMYDHRNTSRREF